MGLLAEARQGGINLPSVRGRKAWGRLITFILIGQKIYTWKNTKKKKTSFKIGMNGFCSTNFENLKIKNLNYIKFKININHLFNQSIIKLYDFFL